MITVTQARALLLALTAPLGVEDVPLIRAAGRVLARPVTARRNQPPFAASSMDGYAMKRAEVERHAMFKVIGEAAAGHSFNGTVGPGQAVRIFTGAPVPDGADFVVIQEDITRTGDLITIANEPGEKDNIRAEGGDFSTGTTISPPLSLRAEDIALMAAMNIPTVPVARKPIVALISTGDELVMPGETPGPDQIIVSNTFGLKAMLETVGADVRIMPIARDTVTSLKTTFELASSADLIVTIGGASVGDHDLVAPVSAELGMERSFYKVAMRPGKPLMAGKLGRSAMVGLPGNPVSAMICAEIFIKPMIRAMLGQDTTQADLMTAPLTAPLAANGPREHYMRAQLDRNGIAAFDNQDSAMLSVLARADALLVRPANDPARAIGEPVAYLPL
ncbi:molybdopterin molybdotransferase MoeA [Aliisedimentitalea scapharcae]|uniref:Molybdopterin molybdenumtransferase n=1 Tax=Aliisedimentitalea scapharcae TaxID=1524259 RepID=A0ABZ2Y1T2_9RHOB